MHFINEFIYDGVLSLEYLPTKDKVVDILKKPMASPHFLQLQLMVVMNSYLGGHLESPYFHPLFFLLCTTLCCTWVPKKASLQGPIFFFVSLPPYISLMGGCQSFNMESSVSSTQEISYIQNLVFQNFLHQKHHIQNFLLQNSRLQNFLICQKLLPII